MKRKPLWIIACALALGGCSGPEREPTTAAPVKPVVVTTITAAEQQWPAVYQTTGTVRARTSTVIAAKLMGYVREVLVREGDHVRQGQVLMTLDARDLDVNSSHAVAALDEVRSTMPEADSAIAAAQANLDLAQTTFQRMQDLLNKRSISSQEFDEASAKLKAAQAARDQARSRRVGVDAMAARVQQEVRATEVARSYATITAPFAAVVTAKAVDAGAMAVPGAPLLTIEREGAYRFEAAVEESHLTSIGVGQPVSVKLDGMDQTLQSRVSEIVPAVDSASRSYIVKIDLPALAALRSGLFGRASFSMGSRSTLAVPAGALREHGQLQSLLVAENGVARARLITVGERSKDQVEVLSGLTAGENVIFPVPRDLTDGTPVEAKR